MVWLVDLEQVMVQGDIGMQVAQDAGEAAGGELLHAVGQVGRAEPAQPWPERLNRNLPVPVHRLHHGGQVAGRVLVEGP
jgi:hypothetical protein